ncbi:MAG: SUMF1/EgtB/PvdO family nonheme iron enzyme [Xanthomonadales bacterium]|nr:SUMF1/EgtB/PvdO family nonheme iron enzyme [Xanthomonadales bacterium]
MSTTRIFLTSLFTFISTPLMAGSNIIEPLMANIPGGEFMMGGEGDNVSPIHKVHIKPFQVGKYEVTVKEFAQFIEATGYPTPTECRHQPTQNWHEPWPITKGTWTDNDLSSNAFQPVVCIGAKPAKAYATWLSKVTGKPYRLLTEAEWEYTARAGAHTLFSFGDDPELREICQYENIADLSAEQGAQKRYGATYSGIMTEMMGGITRCDDHSAFTSIVGMYQPNSFGIYDMIGNVTEYVEDCSNPNYEGAPTDGSAWLSGDCSKQIVRGSSWHWLGGSTRDRGAPAANWIGALEGFRLALDSKNQSNNKPNKATKQFENELRQAQIKAAENHKKAVRN